MPKIDICGCAMFQSNHFAKETKRRQQLIVSYSFFIFFFTYVTRMQMQEPQAKKRKQARKEPAEDLSDVHAEAYSGNLSLLGARYLEHKAKNEGDPLDSLQRSPLHYACLAGNIDCIRYLIDQGSDINLKDVNGQTPISLGLLHNCSPSFNKFVAELIMEDQDYSSVVSCRQSEMDSHRSFLVRVGRKRKNPSEENSPVAPPYILDLPTEMTCSIFSYNDASMFFIARLVCKKWFDIFSNESSNVWPYVHHVNTKKLHPFFPGQTLVNGLNQLTTKLVSLEFRSITPVSSQAEFTALTKLTNLMNLSYDSTHIHRKLFDVSSTYLLAKPFVPYSQIRSLDFRSFCDFMNFDQIEQCTGLKELYLSSTHLRWGTTQSFELTLMKLTQIEKLALSIDDPLILKDYTSLKELDMKVYQVLDVTEYHFVIEGLLDVLKNNQNLELLRLSIFKYWRSSKCTTKFIRTLPSFCKSLKVLECDQFLVGSDTDFANIAAACPNLEVLAVDVSSRSYQFWKKSKIGDATLLSIAKNCPKFRRLCAAKCQITDKGAQTLVDNCADLEAIVFSSYNLRQLRLFNKPKLEYVKLPACGALNSLRVYQCPRLGDLHISDCSLLTELHLEQCSRPLMMTLSCASSLNVVRMTDVSLFDVSAVACYQFEHVAIESKSAIRNLEFPYCHQLKSVTCMAPLFSLNLDGCQQLQELDIAQNYLESLHLSECHQLSNDQVFRLIKGSDGSLKTIDMRYNNKVSAATIKAIGTYAPGVKELMLSYCYHVTEDALLHVLANCKSLLQLIVNGLQSVTDRVVEAAKSHPTLTLLNASSCPYVSQSFKKSPRNSKLSIIL